MYYAFAIVKRVRAALRALRAPRLSEPAWRSRACSYAAVHTCHYTYVYLCVCVCVYSLSPGWKKEEEREREEVKRVRRRKDCSDDAVTVAFPKLLFPTLFPSFPLHPFSLSFSILSTRCMELEQLEFEEAFRGKGWGAGSFGFRGQNLRA